MRAYFTSDVARVSPEQLLREADAGTKLACCDALNRLKRKAEKLAREAGDPSVRVSHSVTRCMREDLFIALREGYVNPVEITPTLPTDLEGDFSIVQDARWDTMNLAQQQHVRRLLDGLYGARWNVGERPVSPETAFGLRLEIAVLLTDFNLVHKVG